MTDYRTQKIVSVIAIALMAVIAGVALSRLPPGTQLPTHWGADGVPDRFADAAVALFLPVALTVAVAAVMAVLPAIEPMQERMEASAPLYRTAWMGMLVVMVAVEAIIAAPAFGRAVPASAMLVVAGAMFIVLGNAMPKSRPGFFVGIRTPWTLTDSGNWIATHRFGGRLSIAGGVAIAALGLLPISPGIRLGGVLAATAAIVIVPVAYSWRYWRRTARNM